MDYAKGRRSKSGTNPQMQLVPHLVVDSVGDDQVFHGQVTVRLGVIGHRNTFFEAVCLVNGRVIGQGNVFHKGVSFADESHRQLQRLSEDQVRWVVSSVSMDFSILTPFFKFEKLTSARLCSSVHLSSLDPRLENSEVRVRYEIRTGGKISCKFWFMHYDRVMLEREVEYPFDPALAIADMLLFELGVDPWNAYIVPTRVQVPPRPPLLAKAPVGGVKDVGECITSVLSMIPDCARRCPRLKLPVHLEFDGGIQVDVSLTGLSHLFPTCNGTVAWFYSPSLKTPICRSMEEDYSDAVEKVIATPK